MRQNFGVNWPSPKLSNENGEVKVMTQFRESIPYTFKQNLFINFSQDRDREKKKNLKKTEKLLIYTITVIF